MMAKRILTILPNLTFEESLEITKIYSISGKLPVEGLVTTRPFRNPHHTISDISLIGGGRIPKPGEVSLAHNGVLFLDELPEFKKQTLEALRLPLEDKNVLISRVQGSYLYPCNFMLVASMNPCPCGYLGDKDKECKCTDKQILDYRNRISGPLLDRIDMHIEVPKVKIDNFENKKQETSAQIRERVNKARYIQINRYKDYGIYSNSELNSKLLERFCILSNNCKTILNKYFEKLKLSARSYSRILKLARTIADLDNSENIREEHILEAIQYRSLDKI
jgi:magnesium chelatase family protein